MMALLAVFTGGEGLFAIVTGTAEFSSPKSFHGQSVARIGTAFFFLEQGIMAVATPQTGSFMALMIERHRGETFRILVNYFSGLAVRPDRGGRPDQTEGDKDPGADNPHFIFHNNPFQNGALPVLLYPSLKANTNIDPKPISGIIIEPYSPATPAQAEACFRRFISLV